MIGIQYGLSLSQNDVKMTPILRVTKKNESQFLFSVAADHNVHSVYLVLFTSASNITNQILIIQSYVKQ